MDQMNALGAGASAPAGAPMPAPPQSGPPGAPDPSAAGASAVPDYSSEPLTALHAQYAKMRQAEKMMDSVKNGLVELAKLGDTVTTEDLIRESGKLVAEGLDPKQMAGMLADAPEKGDLLSEWVDQHLQQSIMMGSQVEFAIRGVRQEIGVRAMHGLMMQHAENGDVHG